MGADEETADNEALLEVGHIGSPHGLRGEIAVRLTTNRPERLGAGSVLVVGSDEFVVRSSRPHKAGHLVVFEGVASRDAARSLAGRKVLAEPIADGTALWAHELIGCEVVDQYGITHGQVEALQENPASDLLLLDGGALVPLTFVSGPPQDGQIRVEAPDGLFDL